MGGHQGFTSFACATLTSGAVKCWGTIGFRPGITLPDEHDQLIAGVADAVQVSVGTEHACGGLWVDNVGATTMVNHGVPREVIALVGALPSPDGPTEAQDQDYRTSARSARRCPVCAVPLEARGIRVADGRVEVDVCDAHGTFFDPRELAAVSGGFMLARRRFDQLQAEADRVRDAATPAEVSLDPVLGPLLTALAEASRPRREWNE